MTSKRIVSVCNDGSATLEDGTVIPPTAAQCTLPSKTKLSDDLKCPECGWIDGHNIACKYDLRQEIERLSRDLAESERLRGLANDACDGFQRRIEHLERGTVETKVTLPAHCVHMEPLGKHCWVQFGSSHAERIWVWKDQYHGLRASVERPISPSIAAKAVEYVPVAAKSAEEPKDLRWALDRGDELADWINRARPVITELMGAYERRIRTDCTPEDLAKQPWRCMEYIGAEALLQDQPKAVVEIPRPLETSDLREMYERRAAEKGWPLPEKATDKRRPHVEIRVADCTCDGCLSI